MPLCLSEILYPEDTFVAYLDFEEKALSSLNVQIVEFRRDQERDHFTG